MSSRKLFLFSMVAVLCLGRPAFTQENGVKIAGGATAQIIRGRSASVKVTDAEGKVLASIPIEKDPGRFIYSESVNTLYVIHNAEKGEHFISAVNLTTNRVDKQITVGAGWVVELLLSNDGHRLFCYTGSQKGSVNAHMGASPSIAIGESGIFYASRLLEPPFKPVISVIDTASNEVIATYDWLGDFRADLPKDWYFMNQILGVSDGGHLIVGSEADTGRKKMGWDRQYVELKPIKDRLMVFSVQSSHPAFMIDPGGRMVGSTLSKDEKLFFAAVKGDERAAGSLVVVDLEKGTIVHHALTGSPTRLLRLGSKQEPWVFSSVEMRSLSETGELGERRISLNKPSKPEEGGESVASAFMDSQPGQTLSLGEDHAAILIYHTFTEDGSRHKVALIDLKKLQVDAIIPTMSAGEIARIHTGRIMTAVAMVELNGPSIPSLYGMMTLSNEMLTARPDGRFLYALDLDGHKVTVIDVQTATVVKRISVNEYITEFHVSSDGKQLICTGTVSQQYADFMNLNFSGPVRQTINLETNNLEN